MKSLSVKNIFSVLILVLFGILATGSTEMESEADKLATKYDMSASNAQECLDLWGPDTDSVIAYLSNLKGGFLGFFRQNCKSLSQDVDNKEFESFLRKQQASRTRLERERSREAARQFQNARENAAMDNFLRTGNIFF